MVPYVEAVVHVTVMRVMLFVLHVCVLIECEGSMVTEILVWCPGGGVVVVSAGCEYMCGSGFVSTADDVLEMSVVREVRGVGGVCEMYMCLARGWVGVVGGG